MFFSGVGLETEIEVSNRPVTREGMLAMGTMGSGKAAKSAQKRKVQDESYYMEELSIKNGELETEINRLKAEIAKMQSGKHLSRQLDDSKNSLKKELSDMQENFKNINFAVQQLQEKTDSGGGADGVLEAIENELEKISNENSNKRVLNTEIFKQRKEFVFFFLKFFFSIPYFSIFCRIEDEVNEIEGRIQIIESQMQEQKQEHENKMMQMNPNKSQPSQAEKIDFNDPQSVCQTKF